MHPQLTLPFGNDEAALRAALEHSLKRPLTLTLTDTSRCLISVRIRDGALNVRLHRMFLAAGDDVIAEIVRFIKTRKGTTPLVHAFARRHIGELKPPRPRLVKIKTAGKYHDLLEIFRTVNDLYFGGRISCAVTWGVMRSTRGVRKRTLGSFSGAGNVIRINPSLDRKAVPRFYMEFLMYHEMLHASLGIEEKNGRRAIHTPEFKRMESAFPDYARAIAWEKAHA